jgi:hypothetical protein
MEIHEFGTLMEIHEILDPAVEFLTRQISSSFEGHPSKLYGWSGAERSAGVHLSDILQDLYVRMNPAKKSQKEGGTGNPELLWSIGLAWENILSWGWSKVFPDQPDRILHLGEFEKDGIILTPDRIDTVDECVVEMKATWKSAITSPVSENWFWLQQTKSYCYALGLHKARFHVLYVNGGYHKEPYPFTCIRSWNLTYTTGELQRTWDMITQHRDNLLKEGKLRDHSGK